MPASIQEIFPRLGLLYRKRRIAQRIKLETMAARCGISTATVRAIERGSAAVKIGSWLAVAEELGLAGAWDAMLADQVDPFAEYDRRLGDERKIRTARVRSTRRLE